MAGLTKWARIFFVVAASISVMAPIAAQEQATTAELISQLTNGDPRTRVAARKELALRGGAVVPELMHSIEGGVDVKYFLDLLGELGPAAEPAIPLLERDLVEPSAAPGVLMTIERIKPGAARTLSAESKQQAADSLYAVIIDPESDVMAGVSAQLLMLLGDAAGPTLLRMLRHDGYTIRGRALREITRAKYGRPDVLAEVEKLSESDPDREVQARAAAALAVISPPGSRAHAHAREILLDLLRRPVPLDDRVADAATQEARARQGRAGGFIVGGLAQYGPGIIEDLLPLLTPMDNPKRIPAISVYAAIGEPAVPRLIELMGDEDEAVAISASVALNRIGKPAVPALAQTLSNPNEQVVRHALNALWWIGRRGRAATPALLATVGSDRQSDALRAIAARTALKVDPTVRDSAEVLGSVPALVRTLEGGAFRDQGAAAESLGQIGPPARDALPLLQKRLLEPAENVDTQNVVRDYVTREAARAIQAIEGDTGNQDDDR